MVNVDLFDTPHSVIQDLKKSGHIVVCYISAGTWEPWREDLQNWPGGFPKNVLDTNFADPLFQEERLFRLDKDIVLTVWKNRLQTAAQKGCDGVEPDNMDIYTHEESVFHGNINAQKHFVAKLIREVRNLTYKGKPYKISIGQKNAPELVPYFVNDFDWVLTEEAFEYEEELSYEAYAHKGKAIFSAEYWKDGESRAQFDVKKKTYCKRAADHLKKNNIQFQLVFYKQDLLGWREYCN